MRRSICVSEPNHALAGQVYHWKFSYTTSSSLPKGALLRFDFLSRGRDIDWQTPSTSPKEKSNVIYLELPNKKTVAGTYEQDETSFSDCFVFTVPSEIKAGETIIIHLDENRAQTYTQRRRPFYLYIDPKGKGDFRDPEVFTVDIKGNKLHTIKVIAPSLVTKNRRFDVIVRFEDEYSNLTSNAPEGTLIELSYEHLRENLNWKLFVPETGFISLPNLYFNETGIYKIQLLNTRTKEKFFSSPIRCFAEGEMSIYWGTLHGESEKFDSSESVEQCLRLFRDEKGLSFYGTSCFENVEETTNDDWKLITQQVAEFNEEGRFSTFLGMQWYGGNPEEGLKQLIYSKDSKPILRRKDAKSNTLRKIYKGYSNKELLSICSFTMAKGFQTNFQDIVPEYERLVEIYNAWGSSECLAKDGNPRPIATEDGEGINETDIGSIRKALNQNHRFGFTAGGLDDRGVFSGLFENDQAQYSPGLTAIISVEHTRESLFQALYQRSCYATTGERIVLGFNIAGARMGSELSTKAKPGLVYNRHITGYISGTAPLSEIAIIKNGTIWKIFSVKENSFDIVCDDSEHLSKCLLPTQEETVSFCYYYLRITQEDGHMAWSSPIWIDHSSTDTSGNGKKTKKKAS